MNKAVMYITKVPEEYEKKCLVHMIAERLLSQGLKAQYQLDLKYEPRSLGSHGKPFFSRRPSLHYNITHSGIYVAVIFSSEEIGIDIQRHQKLNYELILKRMVPQEQIPEIMASEDINERFFTLWVKKEAFIKYTGEGMSRELYTTEEENGCCLLLDLEPGYSGAVFSEHPFELETKYVSVDLTDLA